MKETLMNYVTSAIELFIVQSLVDSIYIDITKKYEVDYDNAQCVLDQLYCEKRFNR